MLHTLALCRVSAGKQEPSAASQLEASADDYSIGSRSLDASPQQQYNHNHLPGSPTSEQQDAESPSGQGAGSTATGASTDLPGGYNPEAFARLLVPDDVKVLENTQGW